VCIAVAKVLATVKLGPQACSCRLLAALANSASKHTAAMHSRLPAPARPSPSGFGRRLPTASTAAAICRWRSGALRQARPEQLLAQQRRAARIGGRPAGAGAWGLDPHLLTCIIAELSASAPTCIYSSSSQVLDARMASNTALLDAQIALCRAIATGISSPRACIPCPPPENA
jgi:hypothetical protein